MEHPLVRKLSNFTRLSNDEKDALRNASGRIRLLAAREDLIKEDDPTEGVNLILEGFACRYKVLRDGRRQMLSYIVPGDMCDARVFVLKRMDHSISAFAPTRVVIYPREAILELTYEFPRIARAFWWNTLVEEATAREWIVNLGQRTAPERAAHLLCEVYYRLRAVDMASGGRFGLPVTQAELADTLGLSTVHVNRTLQTLRAEGLISQDGRDVIVHDLPGLEKRGLFDANYLHLRDEDLSPPDWREREPV